VAVAVVAVVVAVAAVVVGLSWSPP